MEWIKAGILFAGLGVNTILDIWKKEISVAVVLLMSVTGLFWRIVYQDFSIVSLIWGLLPGMIGLLIAVITNESIGYGDVWMLLGLGFVLRGEEMLTLSMVALLAAGIWALVLICLFHKEKKYEIPFVPFLLIGYLYVYCAA